MNKKTLIVIIAIVLIIALAIFTGTKLSKKEINPTNGDPVNNSTVHQTPTSEPNVVETVSPEPTEEPTASPEPRPNVDTSKMTAAEKKEYAQSLAKEKWEELNANITVKYVLETILDDGTYLIAVRSNGATKAYCYVDINNNSCKLELN